MFRGVRECQYHSSGMQRMLFMDVMVTTMMATICVLNSLEVEVEGEVVAEL